MRTSILICMSLVVVMIVGTGCYEVVYTAEYKGDTCIKFEDAIYNVVDDVWVEACLGEDGAVEADAFFIGLDGEPEDIEATDVVVTVKAGKCGKNQDITLDNIGGGFWEGEGCDFQIVFAGPIPPGQDPPLDVYEGYYALGVLSDDDNSTPALSNIKVCFVGDGVTVLSPPEGDFTALREDDPDT